MLCMQEKRLTNADMCLRDVTYAENMEQSSPNAVLAVKLIHCGHLVTHVTVPKCL